MRRLTREILELAQGLFKIGLMDKETFQKLMGVEVPVVKDTAPEEKTLDKQ